MADKFKTSVQKVAQRTAKSDENDGPDTEYKIKVKARVPLANAGEVTTVRVKGRATKRELTKDLSKEGYEVVKVECKKPGGWFWW